MPRETSWRPHVHSTTEVSRGHVDPSSLGGLIHIRHRKAQNLVYVATEKAVQTKL